MSATSHNSATRRGQAPNEPAARAAARQELPEETTHVGWRPQGWERVKEISTLTGGGLGSGDSGGR